MLMKTDAVSGAAVAAPRVFSWLIPVAFGLLVALPIIAVATARYPTFDFLTELTVYRIGNAISLLSDEKEHVLPVQGLPVAMLAKFEIWALGAARSTYVMNAATLHLYLGFFFGTLFALATATLAWSWGPLTAQQRGAALLLMACPWLLGGAPIWLLLEPDYWAGEWCYLVISFCLLEIVKENRDHRYMPAMIGAWLAVGLAIKITLLGVGLLFLIALGNCRPKVMAWLVVSFVAAYISMVAAYMGDATSAMHLLVFQLKFFAHPNDSAQWTNVFAEIASRPVLLSLIVACLFLLVTSPEDRIMRSAALLWLVGISYLLWRRPHDTSIASAATVLTFVTTYFIRTKVSLAVVTALVFYGAASTSFENIRSIRATIASGSATDYGQIPNISGMLFMPDNYWNAGLAVQAFGYNGELGLYYPIHTAANGNAEYVYGGKALRAMFPGVTIITDNGPALDVAERAVMAGEPLWWTQHDPAPGAPATNSDRLNAMIARTGAAVETYDLHVIGHSWLLQKAQRSAN